MPSGNLSPIPDKDFENADVWENSENISEYTESNQTDIMSVSSPDMLLPLSPRPSTSNSIPLITTQSETERVTTPESTFLKSKSTPRKREKRNKNISTDVDKAFTEYFESKKAKIAATASDARTDSVKQFLNSLIPDLLTIPPPMNSHSSVATYLSSFSSDESTYVTIASSSLDELDILKKVTKELRKRQ
ncbi:hypothetical protein QTP88_029168 [Uroleucon formosanum]